MKLWRIQITWPGGTATHDVEAKTDWAANLVAIRSNFVPQDNKGYAINITEITATEVSK